MAQPPAYTPVHSFVSDSATLANFPGQALDVEFADVKITTDAIRANLALIQRDDGALANGSVTYDSLSGSVQTNGIVPANAWVAAKSYLIGNAVVSSNSLYRCLIAHTSGTFATDLAAGDWILVSTLLYGAGANITLAGSIFSLSTSPAITGIPTAPTASPGNNSTQLATTAYADAGDALKSNLAGGNAFTGSQTIAPTAASLNQGLVITQTGPASGSSVGPFSANLVNVTFNSTVTGSTNPFADFGAWQTSAVAHRVNFTVGGNNIGSGAPGTTEPFIAGFYQTRLTTATTSSADFLGFAGSTYSNTNSPNAPLHGNAGSVIVDTGATVPVMNGLFSEVDINGTATVTQRRGLSIASQGTGTATGNIDTGLYIASSFSSGAFKKWATFDTSAFQTTADIFFATGAQTVANFANLPSMVVTGNILNFPNVTLSGAGFLKSGTGTADANSGAIIQGAVASGGVASLISQVNGIAAFNGFHTNNSTGVAGLFAVVNEPSAVGTIFGQTDGNWAEIVSSGASHNGLLFGTLSASVPIVFGTNNTERMRLLTGLGVGTTSDPGAGMIYTNAATFIIRTKTSYTNGAAAASGTLTNAPAAGNPTKWIPVDDNGTTRFIPAW